MQFKRESAKARQTAREAFSRFRIHADRQLRGLCRLSLGFSALSNILGLSRLFLGALCLSVSVCLSVSLSFKDLSE